MHQISPIAQWANKPAQSSMIQVATPTKTTAPYFSIHLGKLRLPAGFENSHAAPLEQGGSRCSFSGTLGSKFPRRISSRQLSKSSSRLEARSSVTFRQSGCSRWREANTAHRSIWRRLRDVAVQAGIASDAGHLQHNQGAGVEFSGKRFCETNPGHQTQPARVLRLSHFLQIS